MAYIGKIAAIVTANTSDFKRKLEGSAKDLNKFGNSISATVRSIESKTAASFNNIFTPLQKQYRALAAAMSTPLNIKTGKEVAKIQQLVSASELLAKPLSDAAGQFDKLSFSAKTGLAPELTRLQAGVLLLKRKIDETGSAGDGAFAILERRIDRFTAKVNRASVADTLGKSLGGKGTAGLALGIDSKQIQGVAGELEFLQGRLSGLTSSVRGPVLSAMERYRQVTLSAFRDGSIATEAGRAAIARARSEVVKLGAAVLGVRAGRLGEQMSRIGDVARGFGSKFSLAAQQAAFAVDDFFSVTGDASQRIRAIGNNLTQLGFVLGGTAGLFAALAASLTAQGVVALVKWINANVDATDKTKALNDALSRQKTAAEELAKSYQSVVDALKEVGLSQDQIAKKRERTDGNERRRLGDVARREAFAAVDPATQRQRAIIEARRKQLESETDLGRRAILQQEISAAEAEEKRLFERTGTRIDPRAETNLRDIDREITAIKKRIGIGTKYEDGSDADRLARIAQLERRRVQIQNGQGVLAEGLSNPAAGILGDVGRRIDAARALADSAPGGSTRAIDALFQDLNNRLSQAAEQLNERDPKAAKLAIENAKGLELSIAAAERQVEAFKKSADAASVLADRLKEARSGIDSNFQSARGRLDEARANDLLLGTPATRAALAAAEREFTNQQNFRNRADRAQAGGNLDAVNSLDAAASLEARRNELARRGAELALAPGEKIARQLTEDLKALQINGGDPAKLQADRARLTEEAFRQAAPAIFNLADSVANAVLQGPSRAALQVADATTTQGAAELNRLIRGDDPARNQDLVELRKQSQLLERIANGVENPQVAE